MADRQRREGRLPTTSYAILGLLTFGEMSGYDLDKLVRKSVGFFWTPAKSQIYSALRRLVSLGYASDQEVEQDQRPDKRLYRVTAEGERALREWLESPDVEPDIVKIPLLVKVFFGRLMSRETLAAQVRERRRQAREVLARFRALERDLARNEELLFPYLTLKSGLAHTRATIRWADDVLAALEEGGAR